MERFVALGFREREGSAPVWSTVDTGLSGMGTRSSSASDETLVTFVGKGPTTARRKAVIEFMTSNVQTGFYSAESLERALLALQEHYGMDSETFLRAHRADAPDVGHIPGFHRHTWSSYYLEWNELTSAAEPHADPLATQIERELEPA